MSYKYNAFLSYSQDADKKLAPVIQSALHGLAKPWYRRPAIRVFRDKTSIAATSELLSSIKKALGEAEYFLLLASPKAVESKWVKDEIEW
uniref:TIR domain-containing protein n=1 Tax=Candidatus Kentrum sp. LPFa TaxID=2126335 RepID=A0A450WUI2_9GAMM|nr:MAG: TIR domain-containing protein [Candidatus Kentron sp. LPFa]